MGGFGLTMMDDGSVRRVLNAVAPIQQRNYVVMEVRASLIKEDRKELFSKWSASGLKRTVVVIMGEPPKEIKQRNLDRALQYKQEAADAEFKVKQAEEKKRKEMEKQKLKIEQETRRKQEEMKRKFELAMKEKEAK